MASLGGWDNHCKSTAGSYLAVLCRTACWVALGELRVVPCTEVNFWAASWQWVCRADCRRLRLAETQTGALLGTSTLCCGMWRSVMVIAGPAKYSSCPQLGVNCRDSLGECPSFGCVEQLCACPGSLVLAQRCVVGGRRIGAGNRN